MWLFASRRGYSFELETTRRESPTLYGVVCKVVASKGGGPGDRWHLVKSHDRTWQCRGPAPPTYVTGHLRYDMPSGYQATNTVKLTGVAPKEDFAPRKLMTGERKPGSPPAR